MTCKYCSRELAPLRSLTDGEFCSDEHRQAFHEAQSDSGNFSLPEQPLATAFDSSGPDFSQQLERNFSFSAPAQTPPPDFSIASTPVEDVSRSGYMAESAIAEESPVEPPPSAPSATIPAR